MSNPKILRTFVNRDGGLCFAWAVLQQLVVAASTLFIIEAIRQSTAGDLARSGRYITAFVASLIIVYLPNTVSLMYLQKWRLASFGSFVRCFVAANGGRTTLLHSRNKAEHESWLTAESGAVYENATSVLYQLYSTLLSSIFNVLVISVAIDRRIFAWYLAAGILLCLAERFFKRPIAAASLAAQSTRKELSNVMLTGWDNIFVGNRYNLDFWLAKFGVALDGAKRAAVGYDRTRSIVSSLTGSMALLVIVAGNANYYFENKANIPAVAALIITLPRQLQIVQNIFAFFNIYLSWKGLRLQMRQLESVLGLGEGTRDLTAYIQLGSIGFHSRGEAKSYATVSSVLDALRGEKNGRVTVRGKNGAGKSTILSLLAQETGERSYFLPSNNVDLAFASEAIVNHSDGNRILNIFQELARLEDVRYVILDEWDANLDSENISKLDALIDTIASTKLVIESRHRA